MIGSISSVDRSTNAAPFGGVAGIDFDDWNADEPRLVFDEAAELGEGPRMQARSLRLAGLNPTPDVLEVFKPYRAPGAFSLVNEHLRDAVVGVFAEAGLLARESFQTTLGSLRAAPLEPGLAAGEFAADLLNIRASVAVAIAVESDVDDAEVHAENAFNADLLGVRNVADAGQIPLAPHQHKIDLALAERKQGPLPLAANEGDFLPAIQRPDADQVAGHEADDAVIIGLGCMAAEGALSVLAYFVGVSDLGNAAHSGLGSEVKHRPHFSIGQFVQVELAGLACLKATRRDVIARLITALKRLPKQRFLLGRWQQLDVRYKFHISNMETCGREVKLSARPFLRHLKEAVSGPQGL